MTALWLARLLTHEIPANAATLEKLQITICIEGREYTPHEAALTNADGRPRYQIIAWEEDLLFADGESGFPLRRPLPRPSTEREPQTGPHPAP